MFVLKPNSHTFKSLLNFAKQNGSFDGGDQGLLNSFFSTWSTGKTKQGVLPSSRLPFTYNVTPSATYSYLPAYMKYYNDIHVVHFIGAIKPWNLDRFDNGIVVPRGNMSNQMMEMIQKWLTVYDSRNHDLGMKVLFY